MLDKDDDDEDARARALVGLSHSGLLKRFESSAFAFRRTVEKMAHEHDLFMDALDEGRVVSTAFMEELSADDDAAFEDVLAGTARSSDAALHDIEGLRRAVERDRDVLRALAELGVDDHTGAGSEAPGAGGRAGRDRATGRK